MTFKTRALNSTTTYSLSASVSLLVRLPRLNVTDTPFPVPPVIEPPGTPNVGETLALFPETTKPAPESVEDVMQLAPPLQTKATFAVLSLTNCKPFGILSVNCTLVKLPSGNCSVRR